MIVAAIVVAAGQGVRFGSLKQFAQIDDESVAAKSVRVARTVASKVVLVVPARYDGTGEGADVVVTGGATRAESVRQGLKECDDADIIVVHDAARPLASASLFHAVVDAVKNGADAAIPGLYVSDTVKRVRDDAGTLVVEQTIPRENLVTVQTPQAFLYETLVKAHDSSSDATDDAALVEAVHGTVVVVRGEANNVKITEVDDLDRVTTLWKNQ
jgi:2-C-methyl-D-erythritol 4-phosphate cytidylyltransferase